MLDMPSLIMPFNDTVGLVFDSYESDGSPVWRLEPTEAVMTDPEQTMAHAGALAGCIENAASHAVIVAGGDDGWMPADMRVDFHGRVTPGVYRVRGKAVRLGKRLAIGDARIEPWDNSERPVASGRVLFAHT